jgi:predicted nucleic-acid-binding protein
MRSLDTNVLVRYLAADHPKQLAVAEELMEECRRNREPLFLSAIVLCELVWVLARSYDQTKSSIIRALEQILDMDQFRVEYDLLVRRSLELFRNGKGNFSDYLIGEISKQHGCRDTVTFDHALRHCAGFTVLARLLPG